MKLLYFTDPHIRGNTPSNRNDVYYVAMVKKFWEIGEVIKNEKIDFVLIGGDIFDTPTVSNRLLNLFAEIMKGWGVKIFIVPGNHDIFGQNIASLQHTSLGTLSSTGVVKIITRADSPYYIGKRTEPGNVIGITGQEYYEGIDTGVNNDYEVEPGRNDVFKLLISHSFAVEKAFYPGVPHTLISNITSSADLILTGHYHPSTFDVVTASGTKLLKPIGLGRLEATKHNINHKPQYLIFEVENCKLKGYEFRDVACAPDGHDIFNEDEKAEEKEYRATMADFTNAIDNVDLTEQKTIYDMLREIAGNMSEIKLEHLTTATNLLVESEKNVASAELNGYVAEKAQLHITGIIMENFESHKRTEITLKAGALNALVGPSNNGKTAIIRAINWCLYNEPSGSDFIRQGEKYSLVTLKFSNGKWLTRRRTNSDSGSFTVYDEASQQSTEYSKFSNAIPVDVFNASQMPKVSLGGKKKVALNYSEQLEGPFMLSMSSSERAAAIGTITGTNIIDDSVSAISKDIVNLQRSVKGIKDDIDTKENQIRSYDDLQEDEAQLKAVQQILIDIDARKSDVSELSLIENKFVAVNHDIAQVTTELTSYANVDNAGLVIEGIDKAYGDYALLYSFDESYSQAAAGIVQCDNMLDSIGNIDEVPGIVSEIEKALKEYETLEALDTKYKQVVTSINSIDLSIYGKLDEAAAIISTLEKSYGDVDTLSNLEVSYRNVSNSIVTIDKEIASYGSCDNIDELERELEDYNTLSRLSELYTQYNASILKSDEVIATEDNNMAEYLKKYKNLLEEVGICPICESKLTAENVENLTL